MKAIIRNLGPIKNNRQPIDLTKNFYVFVGDNNTGKTYISQLLWTIFNLEVINRFSKQVDIDIDFEQGNTFELSEKLVDKILGNFASFLKKELASTYNIENSPYQETVLGKFSLEFDYDFEQIRSSELHIVTNIGDREDNQYDFFAIDKKIGSLTVLFDDRDITGIYDEQPRNVREKVKEAKPTLKKSAMIEAILRLLLNHRHNTLFLPANRTFYPTFYQYIFEMERERREKDSIKLMRYFENQKKSNSKVDIKGLNLFKRPYTQPINDLFKKIYDFNKTAEISNNYPRLMEKIAELMGGNVATNSVEGIAMVDFLFKINASEKDLPMYMSSSSVNQLTLLYIYLKYWADDKNNFLMIDEPEENLHPQNQIRLLDILIEFANQNNNKVLVTTHSPLLAEAVNNYLYLDVLKNKYGLDAQAIAKEHGIKYIDPDVSLQKEKLGVYFFTGTQIIDYTDDNYGVYFRDFRDVTDSIEKNSKFLTDYIYLKEQENNG